MLPPRRCSAGHLAAHYLVGGMRCAACAKAYAYASVERRRGYAYTPRVRRAPAPASAGEPRGGLRLFRDYGKARAWYEEHGGFLLAFGAGRYGVTDREPVVRRLRGDAWMDRCDAIGVWDEVELGGADAEAAA